MSNTKLLDGKVALVTGAASGIGRAIVKALVGAGAWVAATDKDGAAAAALAKEIGEDVIAAELDVTDAAATARVFDQTIAAFGSLDIVCANAGISTMNPTVDLTEAEWDANMDVNAKGVFFTNQAAVRRWIAAKHQGVIVNTASLAGKLGAPLLAHYSASKFAVVGFTQALAREMGPHGIRVNCVCPGIPDTPLFRFHVNTTPDPEQTLRQRFGRVPLGRPLAPREIADSVLYLAGPESSGVTGTSLVVDAGYTAAAEWFKS